MTTQQVHAPDDDPPDGVGARIHRLRTERGLTQRALAEPEYAAAYVSAIESGDRTPSAAAVRHFAQRLGIETDELRTGRPADLLATVLLDLVAADRRITLGDPSTAEREYAAAERLARTNGLIVPQAQATIGLARAALRREATVSARDRFVAAERLLATAPLSARVPAITGRAQCLVRTGDARYAGYLLQATLAELRLDGLTDPTAMLDLYGALVPLYVGMEAVEKAAEAAREALMLAPVISAPERIADLLVTTARGHLAQGRTADAEAALLRARATYHLGGLRAQRGHWHRALGRRLMAAGRPAEADHELREAIDALRATGDAQLAGVTTELAEVRRGLRDAAGARRLLDTARAELGTRPDATLDARTNRLLGLLAADAGDRTTAREHLRGAVERYRDAGANRELATTLRLLGDVLRADGRPEQAARCYRDGLTAIATADIT